MSKAKTRNFIILLVYVEVNNSVILFTVKAKYTVLLLKYILCWSYSVVMIMYVLLK
jgi:hypothetical protein